MLSVTEFTGNTQNCVHLGGGGGAFNTWYLCNLTEPIFTERCVGLRDSTIVSLADTGTSILAGVTVFAILGNLAYESGEPIEDVVQGGLGLAFVSYPEAISKFETVPQVNLIYMDLM